ncbi:unnamed protein product [Schistocephalus solidus]|uniref:Reverse transcriptase domain-containing protein n=1 Tax=Schistocephalus solidus TaxID=70667 RepID=A0A183SMA8_SCHSO|nr:unnamed protein product [Schistocephalus solidus]
MVRQLHEAMMVRVTDNGTLSEAFTVTNTVKQGCTLVPTLLSLMFSVMLFDTNHDKQPGFRIDYRTDGHLLNSQRMQATTHVSTGRVHDLLFTDSDSLITPAHSLTTWACSVTYTTTKVESTVMPTQITHLVLPSTLTTVLP